MVQTLEEPKTAKTGKETAKVHYSRLLDEYWLSYRVARYVDGKPETKE